MFYAFLHFLCATEQLRTWGAQLKDTFRQSGQAWAGWPHPSFRAGKLISVKTRACFYFGGCVAPLWRPNDLYFIHIHMQLFLYIFIYMYLMFMIKRIANADMWMLPWCHLLVFRSFDPIVAAQLSFWCCAHCTGRLLTVSALFERFVGGFCFYL